jgi:hypothetical protein
VRLTVDSGAVDVNNAGVVLGLAYDSTAGAQLVTTWDTRHGTQTVSATLGMGQDTFAINDAGLALTRYSGNTVASIWRSGDDTSLLLCLRPNENSPCSPNPSFTIPADLNNRGEVATGIARTVFYTPEDYYYEVRLVIWTVGDADDDITVVPTADAYVRAGLWAATNFGAVSTLRVKKGISPDTTRRSYLKFDIGVIKDVERATLRLYGHLSDAGTRQAQTTIYAVSDTSWDERAITWNTRPDLGTVVGRVIVNGTAPQWVEIDVTKFVRAEHRAGRNVISLALRSVDHTSAYGEFQSREAGNTGPRLVITP